MKTVNGVSYCAMKRKQIQKLSRKIRKKHYRGFKNKNPPLRVDPDPNLPEFCLFLFFAEFYFLTVLIFWIKSSEFCWFLFFGNIGITFFDVLIFWNSKIFSPPALENQCKSLVYPLWMVKIFSPAARHFLFFFIWNLQNI